MKDFDPTRLIVPVVVALMLIGASTILFIKDPARFKKLNPENGWGDYKGFIEFVRAYLEACSENPDAVVSVWR